MSRLIESCDEVLPSIVEMWLHTDLTQTSLVPELLLYPVLYLCYSVFYLQLCNDDGVAIKKDVLIMNDSHRTNGARISEAIDKNGYSFRNIQGSNALTWSYEMIFISGKGHCIFFRDLFEISNLNLS